MYLDFAEFSYLNSERMKHWHKDAEEWSGADWGNAMAGECGEACNIIKKLRRHETNTQAYPGPSGTGLLYNTPSEGELLKALAEELADIVTYADLVARYYNINLSTAIIEKFNKVSKAQGFPEHIGER